ncbi:MAG: NADH-quinone oxidoreductase subunit J [Planctomycetota bacterium]
MDLSAVTLEKLLTILFCAGAVTGALFASVSSRVFHSALFLLVSLGSIAGLFFIMGAEFPAVLQLLLYVGGVVVLIVFGIMLTPAVEETNRSPMVKWVVLPALGIGVLTAFLVYLFYRHKDTWDKAAYEGENYSSMMREISDILFGKYLVPFEVLSVTLLVALVGALYIARKKEH